MSTKNILLMALLALVATIIYYSLSGGPTEAEYIQTIQKLRKEKDEFMHSENSPFGKERQTAKPLLYFQPDAKYRVTAKLIPIQNKKMMPLPTSDGVEKKYLEYAYAEFEVNAQPARLLILEIVDDGPYKGTLFLAFADSTSARETYGAGRYLDLKKVPGASTIVLDFNEAYNPYCAYSENYSCPLPPQENVLKMAIRAGEKKYHE
ncbi:MAG: DUF1684 domain-containing protein [Bacteroidetes bacterium]|nr:DUF1684 domain-containing protein [Bacteroidota bacterium]